MESRERKNASREPAGFPQPAGTVLVVDDDAGVLAMTGEMLRLAGYRVFQANIVSEADQIFERNAAEIDVLVSDVQMPSLTGPELAVRLRVRKPRLPVVFMSGFGEIEGPPGTLQKPFRIADLYSKVADALKSAVRGPVRRVRKLKRRT
jgi:FixJ family two-component response regulator